MEVARRRGRRRKKLLDDLKDRRGYSHLKEEALDRTEWRHRFGGGFGPVVRILDEWMNEWMNEAVTRVTKVADKTNLHNAKRYLMQCLVLCSMHICQMTFDLLCHYAYVQCYCTVIYTNCTVLLHCHLHKLTILDIFIFMVNILVREKTYSSSPNISNNFVWHYITN